MGKKKKQRLQNIVKTYDGVRKSDVQRQLQKIGKINEIKDIQIRGSLQKKSTKQLQSIYHKLYRQAEEKKISTLNVGYYTLPVKKVSKSGKAYTAYEKHKHTFPKTESGEQMKRATLMADIKTLATNIELNIREGQVRNGRSSTARETIGYISWKKAIKSTLNTYEERTGERFTSEGNRSVYQMVKNISFDEYDRFYNYVQDYYPDEMKFIFSIDFWDYINTRQWREGDGMASDEEFDAKMESALERVAVVYSRFKWEEKYGDIGLNW